MPIPRRNLRRITMLGLPVLAATAVLTAQTPASPTAQQNPIFRATANYVSSIVTPRDGDNRFVSNLRKDEFTVFEDGVRQTIETFVPNIGGRSLGTVSVSRPKPAVEGMIIPQAAPPQDQSGRIFVIFIDDLHLEPLLTPKVRELMHDMRKNLLHDGDLIAIVSSGPSSIEINLTYDLNRIEEARGKIIGNGLRPHDIIMMPDTNQGPPMLRYNVHVAFSAAYDMLTQLEKITNKRKAFVFFSGGYDFNPFKDSRLKHEQDLYAIPPGTRQGDAMAERGDDGTGSNPFAKQGQQFAETDLVSELAELIRAANRANTSFYTVDPRGLMTNLPDISEQGMTAEEWSSFTQITQSSLRVLADETNGFAVVNMNDYGKAFQKIDNLMSDYYVIGYYSTNPDPLKRVRKVEIKATRPGVQLNYTNTYAIPPPPKPPKIK